MVNLTENIAGIVSHKALNLSNFLHLSPNGGDGQGEGDVIFSEQKVREQIFDFLDDI